MANYTKSTDFAVKDTLPTGNPAKIVKGAEINSEFDAIATALATKADANGTGRFVGGDGAVNAPAFSFASDPNTGMYRVGSQNIGFATGGVLRFQILADGGLRGAPTGTATATASFRSSPSIPGKSLLAGVQTGTNNPRVEWSHDDTTATNVIDSTGTVTPTTVFSRGGSPYMRVLNTGQIQWLTPSSGAHTIDGPVIHTAATGVYALALTDGTISSGYSSSGTAAYFGTTTNHPFTLMSNSVARMEVKATGGLDIYAPSSGYGLTVQDAPSFFTTQGPTFQGPNNSAIWLNFTDGNSYYDAQSGAIFRVGGATVAQTTASEGLLVKDSSGSLNTVGWREVPQNTQNGAYTLVLADRGKSVHHTSATPHTWTIPVNTTTAFPLGTAIALSNLGSGLVTISLGAPDSLVFAGAGTTGNRTLQQYGLATLVKVASTTWMISGTGVG